MCKRRSRFFSFFFSLAIWLSPLIAEAQRAPDIEKLRKREVAAIRFIGDSAISDLELESIIATKTSSAFPDRFLNSINSDWGTPRQFIDEAILDEDTTRIFIYYRDRGFFDAHVSYTLHESKATAEAWQKVYDKNYFLPPSKKEAYPLIEDTVIFRIVEGKPYNVEGFTFEGFEKLPLDLQNKVTEDIGIKPKSRFSRTALALEELRVKEILGENGYPFLSLTSRDVERDTVRKTITISLKFKTGPRIKVGGTKIVYDTAYSSYGYVKESVVRRQMSLDSGAWYKNSDRLNSEQDIARLQTFQYQSTSLDTSQFLTVPDSLRNGLILPVIVTLRMRPTQEITPGLYTGISSFNQFILGVDASYTNRNFFHAADNLSAHASYQFFPLPSSEQRWSAGGQFVFPYVFWKNVPFIVSGNASYAYVYNRYLEIIYSGSLGFNASSSALAMPRLAFLPSGSLQYVVRDYYDPTLIPKIQNFTLQPQQFNQIASWDFSVDWRNDPRTPATGSYIAHSFQWGLPFLAISGLPSGAYLKNTLQFRTFFDLGTVQERSVMAFRILGGLIALTHPDDPNRDVLIENRYYGGGSNSLRGWPARSLLVSRDSTPGRPFYGGYRDIEANLEWRYALFQYPLEITSWQQFLGALRLALFIDAGNVWNKDIPFSATSIKDIAVTGGIGIHYNTLFGTIRLDLGLKLYDPYPQGGNINDQTSAVSIPPDAPAGVWIFNRKWQFWDVVHFAFGIGQAF